MTVERLEVDRTEGRLGWRPKVGLREGLRRTLAFYREEREHYW